MYEYLDKIKYIVYLFAMCCKYKPRTASYVSRVAQSV